MGGQFAYFNFWHASHHARMGRDTEQSIAKTMTIAGVPHAIDGDVLIFLTNKWAFSPWFPVHRINLMAMFIMSLQQAVTASLDACIIVPQATIRLVKPFVVQTENDYTARVNSTMSLYALFSLLLMLTGLAAGMNYKSFVYLAASSYFHLWCPFSLRQIWSIPHHKP